MAARELDGRLRSYIEAVRGVLGQPLSDSAKLRLVKLAAKELVSGPVRIAPEDRKVPAEGYGRNLLYKDPDYGFVVIAMVWPAGRGGPPHDHGCWGVVAVSEGEVEVTNYNRDDDGRDPSKARLHSLGAIRGKSGWVGWVQPPHEDFHKVVNPSASEGAVSIHTYAREPKEFNKVDLATGAVSKGLLIYDNG